MAFTEGAAYVPRGRLYFAKWPPLVLLDERVEEFCPELGGLCEDLERAGRAAGLGVGSVGELARRFPQHVPLLLHLLDARFAGPYAEWWDALREDRFPSVAERWEVAERPGCGLPIACPVSHTALLSSPPRSLRLLGRCIHLNKKFRERHGAALWDVVADEGAAKEALEEPRRWLAPLFQDLPPAEELAGCRSTASSMRGRRLEALALFKYWAETGREPYIDGALGGWPPVKLSRRPPRRSRGGASSLLGP
ncbi:hypothetical protein Pogu_0004 [Pyrobaculum oguniense TE7]|uniref:Uncharacterized protein n=1 Tax=Pyrobaculum oguniense (strain DSM 13380 / JCM 10595 / TE7) TaxID=698757 RepID=H6Q601_PYROT|nr:hypothetical protein Pogu_0004 [Pyrobaculum oguniense TE7]